MACLGERSPEVIAYCQITLHTISSIKVEPDVGQLLYGPLSIPWDIHTCKILDRLGTYIR